MTLAANPARLSTASSTFDADFKARLHVSQEADSAIDKVAAGILDCTLALDCGCSLVCGSAQSHRHSGFTVEAVMNAG